MTERDTKAERDLAADLHKVDADPRVFLYPMRVKGLRERGLIDWAEEPRPTRETSRHLRAPAPRAKQLTDKGRLMMALLDRQAGERAAIAGETAARHTARDEAAPPLQRARALMAAYRDGDEPEGAPSASRTLRAIAELLEL